MVGGHSGRSRTLPTQAQPALLRTQVVLDRALGLGSPEPTMVVAIDSEADRNLAIPVARSLAQHGCAAIEGGETSGSEYVSR